MGFPQDPFLSHLPISSSLFSSFTTFFLLLLLLPLLSTVQAVAPTVFPSNNSADLSWSENVSFRLESAQVDLPQPVRLAPLTRSLARLNNTQLLHLNLTGTLVNVDATNSPSLRSSDIAFISCDQSAYPGKLDASATVTNVLNSRQKPTAVLLHSSRATHCNYTDEGTQDYIYLFTLLSAASAHTLETKLDSANGPGSIYTPLIMSVVTTGTNLTDQGGGGSNTPNTAMIILYSITGIITALFLTIIITGAVRAHRHPERYGPRQRPGRPRQSRARGIARAMLETIPIVKFGDDDDGGKLDSEKGDVEMSMASEVPVSPSREDQSHQPPMATGGTTLPSSEQTQRDATATPEPNRERRTDTAETETHAEHPNFACPICTDDFIKGQDLRVLPCNHQFHPECIDPWLVNVSGTCPLCRIDLNPTQAQGENEGEDEHHTETGPGAATERPAEGGHRHRRISTYLHGTLNARRMRDASVEERLAALRSVREETSRDRDGDAEDAGEERRRRNRLTARLRERFRIRTRAHGDDEAREEVS